MVIISGVPIFRIFTVHKLHTLQCKKLPKSSKGCNSVKINSSSTKNPHAHLQYVHNRYAWFQKDPLKTVGGVDYTNSSGQVRVKLATGTM